MARKKGGDSGGPGSGDWLNTYADMVTLLLTFFILLFSMSSMDSSKFNLLVKAFASDVGSADRIIIQSIGDGEFQDGASKGPLESVPEDANELVELADVYEYLKAYIDNNQLSQKVEISQGEGYIFIRFMDDMLFEPNSARLKQSDLEILNFVGYGIKSVQNQAELIRIDGHTAAIPENPNYQVSDRILSSDRANTVLMYFEDTIGIDSKKMIAVTFGKNYPFTSNDNEADRSKNRRVEILISSQNQLTDQMENIYEKLIG